MNDFVNERRAKMYLKSILLAAFFVAFFSPNPSFCSTSLSNPVIYPIQFSIPASKIVEKIPEKTKDFAFIIPGKLDTYIYDDEYNYYQDYQSALYAVTTKKAGWDCMRHYEILANGCIPYFLNLDDCPADTMFMLPKELIKEAMNLEGVSYLTIDHSKFDRARYDAILKQLMDYTKQYLTTEKIADYLLNTVQYNGSKNILFLSGDLSPDYLRCLTLIGLKQLLGTRIVDYPKIPHIYKSYSYDIKKLYGKGISYSKIIDDEYVDRSNIRQRILNHEFDLIIYGSVHRGTPFEVEVRGSYDPEEIVYLCGEDLHLCDQTHRHNLFIREYDAIFLGHQ